MATTTNYSWSTPDDTALVKDGAAAIRSLGTAIDSTVFTNAGAAINKTIIDAAGDLIYGTAADTAARLALGTAGQVLTVNTGATAPEWKTPVSGTITWTARELNFGGSEVRSIAYNGTDLYVAVGTSGKLSSSSDGITWTSRTSGFGANAINKVFFGNSLWIAVGANGVLTTSSDGITWTARTANMGSNILFDITFAASNFVVVGQGGGATNTGGITYSTNGTTWTRKSQTPTIGTNYYGVIYNGTNFIVVANIATNNYLYASTPSGTWTAGHDGSSADLYSIFYDGTRTIINTSDARPRFSTSATLGTTTLYTGVNYLYASTQKQVDYYYDGKYWNLGIGIIGISTTPFTSNIANITNTMFLAPTTTYVNASGNTFNLKGNAIWVGATGLIVASDSGQIFTSF